MKKENIILCILLIAIFFVHHNVAMSIIPSKIAVIDVNGLLSHSSQVKALRNEQKLKTDEFQKWYNTAKADVNNQKNEEEKLKLIKKYDADYAKRMETLNKDYAAKLQKIDDEISAVIAKEAKNRGYDIVLSKNIVLYGGDNITENIAKLIK